MLLPDVNVWLALAFEAHVHHAAANRWRESVPNERCHFCRMTQQGFLRLATNPRVFPTDAVSSTEAWRIYDEILSDPRHVFSPEPPAIEDYWRTFTRGQQFS